jgi:alkanesulfonate monooxygenase SsuD/methylene tetrahydromethanopterin reductase-like flavin-dependent oxidoreductase (luciferase family)
MSHKSNIGININTRAPLILDGFTFSDMLDLASSLEEEGYHSAWVGDSLVSKPRLEPISTLAAVAGRTEKIKLGTATLLLPLRNQVPPLFAQAWATLDVLSQGRSIFCVGVGGGHPRIEDQLEFEMCGVSYVDRGAVFEEGLEVIKKLWTENNVTFSGKFYKNIRNVNVEPKPVQKPTPPIWIANAVRFFHVKPKTTEKIFRRTATMGDGLMTCCLANGDVFEQDLKTILTYRKERGLQTSGFVASHQVTLNVGDNSEKSKLDMKDFLQRYYFVDYTDEQLKMWGPWGSPRNILEWFEDYASHGCDTFVVRFAGANQKTQYKRFTKEIFPSL